MPSRRLALLLVFFSFGLFLFSSIYFYLIGWIDDDFITIYSGETLGRDWWFINYNGERSEMTSSVLAALVAKVAYLIAPHASYLLNRIFMLGCAFAALWLLWRCRKLYVSEPHAELKAACAVLIAASIPSLQYWAQVAMEAPLHALVLTAYTFMLIGYMRAPTSADAQKLAVLQILHILVRSEGFWVIGATFIMLLIVHPKEWRHKKHWMIILAPLAFFILLISLRTLATGLPFPNPAYAKGSNDLYAFMTGAKFWWHFYSWNLSQYLLLITVIAGAMLSIRAIVKRPLAPEHITLIGLMLVIAAQDAFFVYAHGGTGQLARLMVPTLVLKAALLVHILSYYTASLTPRVTPWIGALSVAMAVNYAISSSGWVDNFNKRNSDKAEHHRQVIRELKWNASLEEWNWQLMKLTYAHGREIYAIYDFIRDDLGKYLEKYGELRIATYQAGFFPYYIKKLYPDAPITFFDAGGLMSSEVALVAISKDYHGIVGMREFPSMLQGTHELSPLLLRFDPNMFYGVGGIGEIDLDLGMMPNSPWKVAHQKPGGVIWVKEK